MKNDLPVYILDSYALLAFLGGETGAKVVEDIFNQANRKEVQLYLSLINLGEILYITERAHDLTSAQSALALIDQLPLKVLSINKRLVLSAAHIKANFPLSYADAFVIASALSYQGSILTGDPEFQTVADLVKIHWI